MPAEREVACPKCKAPKKTKAAKNNRLSCASCGHKFLAPSPPKTTEVTPEATVASTKGKKSTTPAVKKNGVTVAKATSVTVKKNAKVRKPKTDPAAEDDTAKKTETGTKTAKEKQNPYAPPPNQERSKHAGRRGGLAYYKRFRDKAKAAANG